MNTQSTLEALQQLKVVDDLIQPTQGGSFVPHQLKKNKKKKAQKDFK
jgi:hypothetical protein